MRWKNLANNYKSYLKFEVIEDAKLNLASQCRRITICYNIILQDSMQIIGYYKRSIAAAKWLDAICDRIVHHVTVLLLFRRICTIVIRSSRVVESL